MLLYAMKQGSIEAVICHAPEFDGPGKRRKASRTRPLSMLLLQVK
ncbi:hypothetical protein VEJY3_20431 [Vibrio sp. EJY3]|nr:hypothetical protein VEJY3_20431 [Vibrio sp. EJY3]